MTTASPAPEPTDEPTEPTEPTASATPAAPATPGPPYQPGTIVLHVVVHVDTDVLWAELPAFPGLFATGATPRDLGVSLGEAVQSYLTTGPSEATEPTETTEE